MFERIKVMIAMALIHVCFGGDSPLGYVKITVLLFFLRQLHYQAKMIQLNRPKIWKDCSQYIFKYMAFKICFLKYFEQCSSSWNILTQQHCRRDPHCRPGRPGYISLGQGPIPHKERRRQGALFSVVG